MGLFHMGSGGRHGVRVCNGLAGDLRGPGMGEGLVFLSSHGLRAEVRYECDFFLNCLQLLHENRLGGGSRAARRPMGRLL